MEPFETLDTMGSLCDTHDILFEINKLGVIIRKHFCYYGEPHNLSQVFSFEIFKYRNLQDCVLEFERRLDIELNKLKSDKRRYISAVVDELSRALAEESEEKNDKRRSDSNI